MELIGDLATTWSHAEIREYLNSFLLRKNEEMNLVSKFLSLSGGERVCLSLASIAARLLKLLRLDENPIIY